MPKSISPNKDTFCQRKDINITKVRGTGILGYYTGKLYGDSSIVKHMSTNISTFANNAVAAVAWTAQKYWSCWTANTKRAIGVLWHTVKVVFEKLGPLYGAAERRQ